MARKTWWSRRTATMRATIVAGTFALTGALTAVIVPVITAPDPPKVEPPASPAPPAPGVTLIDVEVERGTAYVSDGEISIALTLLNTGTSRGIVSEAVVTVLDVLAIRRCYSAGGLTVSGVYDLTLPIDARIGDRFNVDISQQLGPDEADKFVISAQIADAHFPPYMLFRLGIALEVNGGDSVVETGDVVLSLPGDLNDGWLYADDDLEEDMAFETPPEDADRIRECMYGNSAALRRFLSAPGARPVDLEETDAALRLGP